MELRKLPSKYDVVQRLFSVATKHDSPKMSEEVNRYAKEMIELWCKSFGRDHHISLTAVKNRMKRLAKEYQNDVYVKAHRKAKKHNEKCTCTACEPCKSSKRNLEKLWKLKNNELFDIGCNMDELEGDEKLFYEDQKNKRVGRLDTAIDEPYEQEQERLCEAQQVELEREQMEEDFIMQNLEDEQADEDTMNSTMNETLNLSSCINR